MHNFFIFLNKVEPAEAEDQKICQQYQVRIWWNENTVFLQVKEDDTLLPQNRKRWISPADVLEHSTKHRNCNRKCKSWRKQGLEWGQLKTESTSYSGADICKICVQLCAFGLKASHLVKMLPLLHWLISDMELSRILVLMQVMGILFKRQPSWPEVKWWIPRSWISLLSSNS